jgi:disulfide bond formation protein DsbB
MARIAMSCLLVVISIVLALAALGFGLYAAFVSLCLLMPPAAAAATVGTAMTMAAAVLALLAFRRPRKRGSEAHTATAATALLSQWVRENPGQATAAALAIGFIVGSRR